MAYEDGKCGFYTFRAKGQRGLNDKSSLFLLTYPCKVQVKVKKKALVIRKVPRISVENRIFIRVDRIFRMIEPSECLKKHLIEASVKVL